MQQAVVRLNIAAEISRYPPCINALTGEQTLAGGTRILHLPSEQSTSEPPAQTSACQERKLNDPTEFHTEHNLSLSPTTWVSGTLQSSQGPVGSRSSHRRYVDVVRWAVIIAKNHQLVLRRLDNSQRRLVALYTFPLSSWHTPFRQSDNEQRQPSEISWDQVTLNRHRPLQIALPQPYRASQSLPSLS